MNSIPNTTNTIINNVTGVFYGSASGDTVQAGYYGTSYSGKNDITNFDASRCSNIYGNIDHIRPRSIILKAIIKFNI